MTSSHRSSSYPVDYRNECLPRGRRVQWSLLCCNHAARAVTKPVAQSPAATTRKRALRASQSAGRRSPARSQTRRSPQANSYVAFLWNWDGAVGGAVRPGVDLCRRRRVLLPWLRGRRVHDSAKGARGLSRHREMPFPAEPRLSAPLAAKPRLSEQPPLWILRQRAHSVLHGRRPRPVDDRPAAFEHRADVQQQLHAPGHAPPHHAHAHAAPPDARGGRRAPGRERAPQPAAAARGLLQPAGDRPHRRRECDGRVHLSVDCAAGVPLQEIDLETRSILLRRVADKLTLRADSCPLHHHPNGSLLGNRETRRTHHRQANRLQARRRVPAAAHRRERGGDACAPAVRPQGRGQPPRHRAGAPRRPRGLPQGGVRAARVPAHQPREPEPAAERAARGRRLGPHRGQGGQQRPQGRAAARHALRAVQEGLHTAGAGEGDHPAAAVRGGRGGDGLVQRGQRRPARAGGGGGHGVQASPLRHRLLRPQRVRHSGRPRGVHPSRLLHEVDSGHHQTLREHVLRGCACEPVWSIR